MPRVYKRKLNAPLREVWTEEALGEAISKLKTKEVSLNAAYIAYGIPQKTLLRRLRSGDMKKHGLGSAPTLGFQHRKRLVAHIKRLAFVGFAPDPTFVRSIAHQFAEKFNIRHKFSKERQMAGYDWLRSFLERNKDLSIRQAEGLSLVRGQGLNRQSVGFFFNLLQDTLTKYELDKLPRNIYNMDETGIQFINKPGKVVTERGSKDVHFITPKERGESITLIACNNAEGIFLPPALILKGVNKPQSLENDLPPGSSIYMNKKSSYINSDIFMQWLKEHFIPRKSTGKCILLLDRHASHCNDSDMLELADKNDILILCLPGHTTSAIQPLNRSFFSALKTYYNQETRNWIISNKERKITRYQVGKLITKAWKKAATAGNGIAGFRACDIFPFDRNAIPDHFFGVSDAAILQSGNEGTVASNTVTARSSSSLIPSTSVLQNKVLASSTATSRCLESPSKVLHEIAPDLVIPISTASRRNTA